jgi:hypothetical protein
MVARQQLVEDWKSGLAESEQRLAAGSTRFHWLRRVYVRIYRFLISAYGDTGWRADAGDSVSPREEETPASRMPFVDHTTDDSGVDPKSAARIRQTLKNVHAANPQQQRGVLVGVAAREWVTLTSRKKSRQISHLQRVLVKRGFEVRQVRRITDYALEVQHFDFDAALDLVNRTPTAGSEQMAQRITVVIRRNLVASVWLVLLATTGVSFVLLLHEFLRPQPGKLAFFFFLWVLSSWIGWCVGVGRFRR